MADTDRVGSYVPQPGGHREFVPKPLPPDPPLEIDDKLQALLLKADRCLVRLDGSIRTLPNPDPKKLGNVDYLVQSIARVMRNAG